MKVLFAVSNENISTQIVKKYQKEYKEIISYKNVYYFNAIIKELQRDKSYDRIVISEDLEPFANNNYDAIEKFIFEKLDNISDEATGINGEDIPIILLATDKRRKSEPILLKLFGIGIYNVLLGQERTTDEVSNLLRKPRSKKEAKAYYKIEVEEVNYKSENENDVSEIEIKNILNHYRKLGKDEERYIESFNNIAEQYNDAQLRVITKFLPLNVKAVLEEKSPKYQSVMTFTSTAELMKPKKEEEGLKVGFLNYNDSNKIGAPVIVPTSVKKVATKKNIKSNLENYEEENEAEPIVYFDDVDNSALQDYEVVTETNNEKVNGFDEDKTIKRGRGRPKKILNEQEEIRENLVKRGRGRPKKESNSENILPGFDEIDEEVEKILPGFDEITDNTLPGFDDEKLMDNILPGFDEVTDEILKENEVEKEINEIEEITDNTLPGFDDIEEENVLPESNMDRQLKNTDLIYEDNTTVLSKNKKVVSFVGTTKNGTSFLVNNLAKILSSMGIKTAILDLTSNRNSFYIYTKNEEKLRQMSYESIKKLREGIAKGISVDKNLDVYTALPGEILQLDDAKNIVSTLIQNYSIILMDCDFTTPSDYFKIAQEIYIVQSMDIFTIQPMTAFLRELKTKEILEQEKLRIIINKAINVKGLTEKVIIGGLSNYNDPSMSFMTELFDRNAVKFFSIPFDEKVYAEYLEGVMNCELKINGYTKIFNEKLKSLANIMYPLLENPKKLNDYSSNINETLEKMKNKY